MENKFGSNWRPNIPDIVLELLAITIFGLIGGIIVELVAKETVISVVSGIAFGNIGTLLALLYEIHSTKQETLDEIPKKLQEMLGVVDTELLESGDEFGQHLVMSVLKAKRLVLDTELVSGPSSELRAREQELYQKILRDRIINGNLEFKRVEIISHPKHLKTAIERLMTYEGHKYFLRCYESYEKLKPIPVLNMMSFDLEHFYLGGFRPTEYGTSQRTLYIRQPDLASLLREYWENLWELAIPLNESGSIDWKILKRIGSSIGVNETQFDNMVNEIKSVKN